MMPVLPASPCTTPLSPETPDSRRQNRPRPAPAKIVRDKLRDIKENLAEAAAILRTRKNGRVLELCYEDLFLAERSTRWRLVGSLWSHLGLPPCENPCVGRFINNASLRTGKPATYGRLPNLAEIEATFGNDETGHIGYLAPVNSPRRR
jgi:hypothetical protein